MLPAVRQRGGARMTFKDSKGMAVLFRFA